MFLRKTYIRQHERGLLFKRGDYRRLLKPGMHRHFKLPLRRSTVEVQTISTLDLKFEHPLLDVLVQHPDLRAELRSVGLRDIILPGDMKEILNQVLAAEKRAQANLIKRREETAAARSQANTAKLLAENPQLALQGAGVAPGNPGRRAGAFRLRPRRHRRAAPHPGAGGRRNAGGRQVKRRQ